MIKLSIDQIDGVQMSLAQIKAISDLLFVACADHDQAINKDSLQQSTIIINDLVQKIQISLGVAVMDSNKELNNDQ